MVADIEVSVGRPLGEGKGARPRRSGSPLNTGSRSPIALRSRKDAGASPASSVGRPRVHFSDEVSRPSSAARAHERSTSLSPSPAVTSEPLTAHVMNSIPPSIGPRGTRFDSPLPGHLTHPVSAMHGQIQPPGVYGLQAGVHPHGGLYPHTVPSAGGMWPGANAYAFEEGYPQAVPPGNESVEMHEAGGSDQNDDDLISVESDK